MAEDEFMKAEKVQIKFYNRFYFPVCNLTFCARYDVCKNKVCEWLIDELGPAGTKIELKGWKRR